MTTSSPTPVRQRRFRHWRLALLLAAIPTGVLSIANGTLSATSGVTDIANEPLATRPTVQAKPNLMFILDNSGSMNWSYMPDLLGVSSGTADQPYATWYGYRAAQCNGLAYDPSVTYAPPVDSTGTAYPASSFSAAWPDGYTKSATVNLAQSTRVTTSSAMRPGSGSRDFVLSTSGSYSSSTFTVGDAVTVVGTGSIGNTMTGVVTGWSDYYGVWTLTVEVSASTGASALTAWTVNVTPTYYRYTSNGSQPAVSWTYTSNGTVDTSTPFYLECASTIGSTPGSGVFQAYTVSSTSPEATNYANWYSYYRQRYLLMRTAMGRAVTALDSSYRVGFSTISDTGITDGAQSTGSGDGFFRDVKDFDATQKANFYSSLYKSQPNGGTPLRTALSKAGRYFAKAIPNQQYDPMQYACQRNYALLSTDGYWNGGKGVQLDGGTEIGQQDGMEDRPMRDDSNNFLTTVVTYTAPATRNQISTQSRTNNWTRTATTVASSPGNGCGSFYRVSTQTQTYAQQTQTSTVTTPQSSTATYTVTTVATNGVSGAPTTSAVSYSGWINTGVATIATAYDNDRGPPTAAAWTSAGNPTLRCQFARGSGITTYSAPVYSGWSPLSAPTVTTDVPSIGTYTASPAAVTASSSAGTANTLADVAQYYYKTDLRTSNCTSSSSGGSQDVCSNIVRTTSRDPATWQHMNTFTIGLGVSGTLPYDKNYLTQKAGAYADLVAGVINWPSPGNVNSDAGNGGDARNVDDLWHAAVNGRGQYYSALNAGLLAEAINGVVSAVQQVAGAASAASTSSLELVAGNNNQVFRASYTTETWTGDLQAYALNGADASIAATATWSAQAQLDAIPPASRKIYFNNGGVLQDFIYDNLGASQKTYFSNLCSQAVVPSQCALLTGADLDKANAGINLVNYLRGERTYESQSRDSSNASVAALFRKRSHVLGDIVNGAPVHVGKPPFAYADAGYADFVAARASRKNVVYVAANDGMLHAFSSDSGDGGKELWAFVPSAVMPNMYKLADSGYATKHQYFVDGAPVMADIKVGTTWKTILVGGLNGGGRSYYALDITNPTSPSLLWEFTDPNLGYSYGNPVITKRADGTWVVAFASGYNNTSGDGKGHLFVLNANTGVKLLDISTNVGSQAAPSGLAKINAWIDSATDNTSKRFYGGDLLGNLWRFDVDNLVEPRQGALKLATFQISATTPQPITTKPETVEVSGKPVIVVATGRYLGVSDITDATQQSIYAVKDPLVNSGWGDVHADTTRFVKQTFTLNGSSASATSTSVSNTAVDFSTKAGWWIDLPHSHERVVTNLGLQLNTLAIATAIPNGDACASGGASWRYYLNVSNGGVITTNPVGIQWSSNALIVGMSWLKDSSGNIRIVYQNSTGDVKSEVPPTVPVSGAGSVRRTSWRELIH